MSRDAGPNLLLLFFAVLCVVTLLAAPGILSTLVAAAGVIAAVAAWRRIFVGFLAVLILCALAGLADAFGLLSSSSPRAAGALFSWLRPALFLALAFALFSSRRQFRPRAVPLPTDDAA